MTGTIVNAAAVVVGSGLGIMLRRGIAFRYQEIVMQALALSVGLIGLQMALQTQNALIVIVSMALGAITGECLQIDRRLNQAGEKLSQRIGNDNALFAKGFVASTLVYCVGAMAVVGAIQDGLTGDAGTLYAKSMLDGVGAVVFASSMGWGVMFSSVSIFLYQGSITLLASLLSTVLHEDIIREMTSVGGVMIVGLSLTMLEIKPIRVANLVPAILFAAVIASIWN